MKKLRASALPGITDLMSVFNFYTGDEQDPNQAMLLTFQTAFENLYATVITQMGNIEFGRQKWPLEFIVKTSLIPIPANPYSLDWIREQAFELVRNLSLSQQEVLQQIFVEAYQQGLRPEAIVDQVKNVISLNPKQAQQVINLQFRQLELGVPQKQIDRNAETLADKLLTERAQLIARTEMIAAQNQGIQDSWKVARDNKLLSTSAKKEWVEISSSPRTCKICLGLGGQQVGLDETFNSDIIGAVDRPPAHPRCRCTMVLVEDDDLGLVLDDDLQQQVERLRNTPREELSVPLEF